MPRKKIVAGNWKMNGNQIDNAALVKALVAGLPTLAGQVDVLVFPSFPYLAQVQQLADGSVLQWGAQDLSEHPQGAYTGEVSAGMLKDFGCRAVLVGHSERRALFGECDERVVAKFIAAQANGLKPVLCVGETLAEREIGATEQVVSRQLRAVIDRAGVCAFASAVVAYEPVWAIGTGKTASPEQAQSVHALIRSLIAEKDTGVAENLLILYGGSVKADNSARLFAMPDIDGGLVGGASLHSADFLSICRSACLG